MATLIKHPAEIRFYSFHFGEPLRSGSRGTMWAFPLLDEGEALSGTPSVTSVKVGGATSDLVITSVLLAGLEVRFTVAGGTDGSSYLLTAIADTTRGQTLALSGRLAVSSLL